MLIAGGAIAGYWATGSFTIASAPASMTMIARTHAKIGRSMKNFDTPGLSYGRGAAGAGVLAGPAGAGAEPVAAGVAAPVDPGAGAELSAAGRELLAAVAGSSSAAGTGVTRAP